MRARNTRMIMSGLLCGVPRVSRLRGITVNARLASAVAPRRLEVDLARVERRALPSRRLHEQAAVRIDSRGRARAPRPHDLAPVERVAGAPRPQYLRLVGRQPRLQAGPHPRPRP